jgi:hypothetical protein
MHIKCRPYYDKVEGCYKGFVDFGGEIPVDGTSDKLAKESLVFLLQSLKGKCIK